jgi:hypothetical protein
MYDRSRCSVAEAARTYEAWATRQGELVGMSKKKGAKREDRACGVKPDKCECAANRESRERRGVTIMWYTLAGTIADR